MVLAMVMAMVMVMVNSDVDGNAGDSNVGVGVNGGLGGNSCGVVMKETALIVAKVLVVIKVVKYRQEGWTQRVSHGMMATLLQLLFIQV